MLSSARTANAAPPSASCRSWRRARLGGRDLHGEDRHRRRLAVNDDFENRPGSAVVAAPTAGRFASQRLASFVVGAGTASHSGNPRRSIAESRSSSDGASGARRIGLVWRPEMKGEPASSSTRSAAPAGSSWMAIRRAARPSAAPRRRRNRFRRREGLLTWARQRGARPTSRFGCAQSHATVSRSRSNSWSMTKSADRYRSIAAPPPRFLRRESSHQRTVRVRGPARARRSNRGRVLRRTAASHRQFPPAKSAGEGRGRWPFVSSVLRRSRSSAVEISLVTATRRRRR